MSEYNKSKVIEFINANKSILLRLNKFKTLNDRSNIDEFINLMKINIKDVKKIYYEMKNNNNLFFYKSNELKLINSNSSFPVSNVQMQIDDIKKEVEIVKNDLTSNQKTSKYPHKFFDLYDSINISDRKGTMSFSVCNDYDYIKKNFFDMCKICEKSKCNCADINDTDIVASLSLNPKYYSIDNNVGFGRISYYTNKMPICVYNFMSKNYSNRFIFRTLITEMILGDDYFDKMIHQNLDVKNGFFKDKTIGQEIYYYFLEIYNYDRYYYLLNSFENFVSNFNQGTFNEYYNSDKINDVYPPFDGLLYFDHSIYNSIDYPGTEILIFNRELICEIKGIKAAFNKKFYKPQDFLQLLDDFNIFLENPTNIQPIDNVCEEFNILAGGNKNYKKKYMKYKNKYIKLKYLMLN